LIFVKVFVYDIDLVIIKRVPWLESLYPYKFFLLIGAVAAAWAALGTKRAWKIIGYVLVYLFVLLLWRIPKNVFKNWPLFIVFAQLKICGLTWFKACSSISNHGSSQRQ